MDIITSLSCIPTHIIIIIVLLFIGMICMAIDGLE